MWSWGDNTYGQLGNGTTTSVSSPVQVGSLTNWKFIYASPGSQGASCLAIKTDGTLWAWGNGISGQLGINNTTYYSSPVQVGSLTTWKSVVAVDGSALAIQDGYI
jgi:alpha-tubulin suppressor-like RCC1 family protein